MTEKTKAAVEFEHWLAENPPPDLHELVRTYGYWDIPEEAWAKYRAAVSDWQMRRRRRY